MRIGELARRLGSDTPTIRYYESIGVIPAPGRGDNGYREYGPADLHRLGLVLALRRLDVPLDEIRELAGTCFDHRCATSTRRLLATVERRSAEVQRRLSELETLAARFAELRRRLTEEEDPPMLTPLATEAPTASPRPSCDCGCDQRDETCSCGCECCSAERHAEHATAVDALAAQPTTDCSCGCC